MTLQYTTHRKNIAIIFYEKIRPRTIIKKKRLTKIKLTQKTRHMEMYDKVTKNITKHIKVEKHGTWETVLN